MMRKVWMIERMAWSNRSRPSRLELEDVILHALPIILNLSLRSKVNSVKDLFVRRFFAFVQNDGGLAQDDGGPHAGESAPVLSRL